MSEFMNGDGSALVGGLLPSNVGQSLKLDVTGALVTTATLNAPAEQNVNFNQLNGVTPGTSNPLITQDQLRAFVVNGQGYSVSTNKVNLGAGALVSFSLFNPSTSGKNILIVRLWAVASIAGMHQAILTTVDPALGTALTGINSKAGGSASVLTSSISHTTTNQTAPSSGVFGVVANGANTLVDFIGANKVILLPNGSANGVQVFVNMTTSANYAIGADWVEY